MDMSPDDWATLVSTAKELSEGFEPGLVFIGGLATFLHTRSCPGFADYCAFTHDGDFMLSKADYADLRDIEEVVTNRRLSKSQFIKRGFEFDVYVEGVHELPVPYEEALTQSEVSEGLRIAGPEHLLVMKQKALIDRSGSPKGAKDENDMFKLLAVIGFRGTTPEKVARFDDDLVDLLEQLPGRCGDRVAGGNRHVGSMLKDRARAGVEAIKVARDTGYVP